MCLAWESNRQPFHAWVDAQTIDPRPPMLFLPMRNWKTHDILWLGKCNAWHRCKLNSTLSDSSDGASASNRQIHSSIFVISSALIGRWSVVLILIAPLWPHQCPFHQVSVWPATSFFSWKLWPSLWMEHSSRTCFGLKFRNIKHIVNLFMLESTPSTATSHWPFTLWAVERRLAAVGREK